MTKMSLHKRITKVVLYLGIGLGLVFGACIIWFGIGGSLPLFPLHGRILDGLAAQSHGGNLFSADEVFPPGMELDLALNELKRAGFTCKPNLTKPDQYGSLFCRKSMLFHPLCTRGWFLILYIDDKSQTIARSEARTDDDCL